jgi:hypothetical protein
MKKIISILVLAMAFTFSYAQNGSGGSNKSTTIAVDKRAVGTWVNHNGEIYVFNSDGTGKGRNDASGKFSSFKYTFFSNKIVMAFEDGASARVSDYVFSTDGKIFIIVSGFWLTKKE